jgi:hypothetical protein
LELQDIPYSVSFRGYKDDAYSGPFEVLGAIEVKGPLLDVRRGSWLLRFLPVDEEIRQRLGLDCMAGLVRDVVDSEFDCPLSDSSIRVPIKDDLGEWRRCDDLDGVLVEVRGQSPLGLDHGVDQLLVCG